MTAKKTMSTFVWGLLATLFFVANSSALSARVLLSEKVDRSTLVVVGVVTDSRSLYEDSNIAQLGKIYKIRIEKIIQGDIKSTEVLTYEGPSLNTEAAMYFEGGRYLMFLKEISIQPELLKKTKIMKGDELELLKQPAHYTVIFGDQGCYYLGLDATLAEKYGVSKQKYSNAMRDKHLPVVEKYKAAKQEQYRQLLKHEPKKLSEKLKSQKYLESTEKFMRITKINNAQERIKAWEQALNGEDAVLKESARVKLKKSQ